MRRWNEVTYPVMPQRLCERHPPRLVEERTAAALGRFDSTHSTESTLQSSWSSANPTPSALTTQVFADAVSSMAEALYAKDAYTLGHSARVGFYAELIARTIGLDERDIREVRLGGQLHDIGKIGVKDTVLQKDSGLAGDEESHLRQHPLIGEQILAPLLRLHPTVLAIVRWHHERYDGHGFPDGLGGSLIPLGSRIVAIADAFDAMTSRRPYRSALPFTVAVRELVRESGRQFDPACVRAFLVALGRIMQPDGVPTGRPAPQRTLVLEVWISDPPVDSQTSSRTGRRARPQIGPERVRRVGAFDLPRRSRGPPWFRIHMNYS